ncbi:hypothetical protein LWI29_018788 [Acer saccharum]|uniref:DUF4283 domain-containing protein n=1 Tax=Acer saccharum TaxID=4024 RepID=A0AA39RDV3_ACESA|nr:hypothetical protein LWI29_018788 [Acer saccharum]
MSQASDRVPMSVGVSMHGSVQSSGLLVQGNKSYADLFKTSHSLPRGKAIVGEVDLPVGSSLPLSSIRGSSCADLFMATQIQEDNVSSHSILSKKGGYVAVQVDPSTYKSRFEVCKFSLIGRVILSNGEKPWKLADLKAKMQSIWKLNSVWRLISLGKGYFQILLNLDADKNMVWSLGSLNLKPGVLRLQPWIPDFNPALHKGIGVPLRLDRATVESDFGHFARILVDIDVSTVPPSSLLLERDESHSSFISVEYENLPAFCSICSFIGHFLNVCRWNKSDKGIPVSSSKPDSARDGPATVVVDEGFQVPHKHAPKLVFPQAEVPISNVFAAIQQDLGSLDSIVVHSSAGSNPILGMVSSASLVDSPC